MMHITQNRNFLQKTALGGLSLAFIITLSACSASPEREAKYPTGADRSATGGDIYSEAPSIFGSDGVGLFGRKKDDADSGAGGIGVNAFLWRAALDTVSFMPLASADPFGGVILTDWYSAPETPNERFKVNVFILDRQLRSDGVQVRVFKQRKSGSTWRDTDVSPETARKLEDTILTRARQMRVAQMRDE